MDVHMYSVYYNGYTHQSLIHCQNSAIIHSTGTMYMYMYIHQLTRHSRLRSIPSCPKDYVF